MKEIGADAALRWTDALDGFHRGWTEELAAHIFSAMYAKLLRDLEAHISDAPTTRPDEIVTPGGVTFIEAGFSNGDARKFVSKINPVIFVDEALRKDVTY